MKRFPSDPTPEIEEEPEHIEEPENEEQEEEKRAEQSSSEEDDFDIPAMAVYVDDKQDNIQDIVKEETKS